MKAIRIPKALRQAGILILKDKMIWKGEQAIETSRRIYSQKSTLKMLQQTVRHYNAYPYEVGIRNSQAYTSPQNPLGKFILEISGGSVLDLGCGPGNLLLALSGHANTVVGIDLSQRSLHKAAQLGANPSLSLGQGNMLELPFSDRSFDFVVAAGSLHHTPDARQAFIEACRVLRPGGRAFITLYQAGSYYFYLYRTLGYLAQACESFWLTAILVNRCLILPVFLLYFLVGRLLVHGKVIVPSYRHILNYFADQILNPIVSFHKLSEIVQWTEIARVEIISVSSSHAGALISVEVCRPNTISQPS